MKMWCSLEGSKVEKLRIATTEYQGAGSRVALERRNEKLEKIVFFISIHGLQSTSAYSQSTLHFITNLTYLAYQTSIGSTFDNRI